MFDIEINVKDNRGKWEEIDWVLMRWFEFLDLVVFKLMLVLDYLFLWINIFFFLFGYLLFGI